MEALLVTEEVAVEVTDVAAVVETDDVTEVVCDEVPVVDPVEDMVLLAVVVTVEVSVVVAVVFVQSEKAPSCALSAAMFTLYTACAQSSSSTVMIWLRTHAKASL